MGVVFLCDCMNVGVVKQMKVCVLTESQVLDTSPCAARASFFLEESRELFHCTNFSLNSVKDLEEFWFHLQDVCVNTRIILPSCE